MGEPTMTAREQLERWALFQEADGYLTCTFTDCGEIKLGCERTVSCPGDFVTRCEHYEDACECPQTGWIAEFSAHGVKMDATYPGDHGEHVWAFGLTFDAACEALVDAIRSRNVCACNAVASSDPSEETRNG